MKEVRGITLGSSGVRGPLGEDPTILLGMFLFCFFVSCVRACVLIFVCQRAVVLRIHSKVDLKAPFPRRYGPQRHEVLHRTGSLVQTWYFPYISVDGVIPTFALLVWNQVSGSWTETFLKKEQRMLPCEYTQLIHNDGVTFTTSFTRENLP